MNWRGRSVAVVGLGVSNMAVIRYLTRHGARIVGFDQKSAADLGDTYAELKQLGVTAVLGPDYLDQLVRPWDAVVLTPGMPKTIRQLQALRDMGVPFESEIGLFFALCKAPIIGVTGSSGKTTTATLIGEILKKGTRPVFVGGNIGVPLLEKVEEIGPESFVVLELSSFQLEMVAQSPQLAVITNITPNHLDIHGTMSAYVAAKRRIFEFQGPGGWVLFNADDDMTRAMVSEAPGYVATFSRKTGETAAPDGNVAERTASFVEDGHVIVRTSTIAGGRRLVICAVDDIALPGQHNVENVLAATAVAAECGIDAESIRSVVTTFTGVPHRLEFVGRWNGVRYYNDSIATSPARAVAGVQAFEAPIVLIAGGSDKQLPFDPLAAALPGRVHSVVLLGVTAPAIEAAIRKHGAASGAPLPQLRHADSFEEAVQTARALARPGDVVLLSPACASYDMFPNFEVRGNLFRTIVHGFGAEQAAAK